MVQSKFHEDKRKEELFGVWLDSHFYPKFKESYKSITRNTDVLLQKRGVDVIVETLTGTILYVDEKATLQYINKRIPTFAFEIMNTSSGAQGWLYNPAYLTHYYLLAWPNASDEGIPDAESFFDTEVMSIRRSRVIELLCDSGLTESRISELVEGYSRRLSENNRFEIAKGITLNFNLSLAEKPINVVVKKELISKYADYSALVG